MKHQIKAVGYGRTSSEDKGEEKVSVDQQKESYLAACKANGWLDCGWHEDRDSSGRCYPVGSPVEQYDIATANYLASKPTGKKHRKGLAAALKAISDSKAMFFYVRDVTRFARPVSGSLLGQYLRGVLQASGCQLWSGNEGLIDYTKLETRIVRSLQDELEDHAIKTKAGQAKDSIRAKRDRGEIYRDPTMFGFRSSGHGKVAGVTSELETVKLIYSLFFGGLGLNAIARKLNNDKVKTMTNKAWAFSSVRKILARPLYTGHQLDSKGSLIASPVYMPLATVSLADHRKALAILAGQSRPKWQSKYVHPLQGLLWCGYCGHQMGSYTGTGFDNREKTYFYRCDWSTYLNKEQAGLCRKTLIRETLGTPAKVGQKKGYLSKEGHNLYGTGLIEMLFPFTIPGYIKSLKARANQGTLEARRNELLGILATLKANQVQRYSDKEKKLLDDETYSTLAKALIIEKAEAEKELNDLDKQIQEVTGFKLTMKNVSQLENITATEYHHLIRQVVDKVLIFSDRIEVHLKGTPAPISLERIQDRNSRLCPSPIIALPRKKVDALEKSIIPGNIIICYLYKSAVVYDDAFGEEDGVYLFTAGDYWIKTIGNNNPSKSTLKKRALIARRAAKK